MGKRNQITYNGANSALFLWTQDTGVWADWQFTKLVPGTSGVPPTAGDPGVGSPVSLGDQIILSSANRPVSTATSEVIITGSLSLVQANGVNLREVGLILGNGQLFARQIYPVIAKNGSITVTYTWRISVVTPTS